MKIKLLTYQLRTAENLFDPLCKLDPGLKVFIRHPDLNCRLTAASCLGDIGPTASNAVPELIQNLKGIDEYDTGDGVIYYRAAIAYALGKIGDKRAIAPLLVALKSSSLGTKGAVAEALGDFGPEAASAVPLVIPLLSSETAYTFVVQQASGTLGKIGERSSVPPLVKTLKKGKIISGAVCALAKLAPNESDAIEVIRPLVTFKEGDSKYEPSKVRSCAVQFMKQLKK